MIMENEQERLTVEHINELPLEQRAAAFAELERTLRDQLDDQSR
ncbi:MAG: hypothetical protein RJA31_622 [Actinomycetota bacterium]